MKARKDTLAETGEKGEIKTKEFVFLLFAVVAFSVFAQGRENFVQEILPSKYPQLVAYVRANGALPVVWTSQTGEQQSLTVEMTVRESLTITTTVRIGPADDMNSPTIVIMVDRDLDSRLDAIRYLPEGDESRAIESPTDEASLFLWDTALATTMNFSECCPR